MSGGGSKVDNEFKPPEWTREQYPGVTQDIMSLVSRPPPMYAGMKVAPMNAYQQGAGQLITDNALYGNPQLNAASGSLMALSQGAGRNPYADNAYTDRMIAANARDMTDAHKRGTAVQNDALAARGGGYGGSAHLDKQALDASELTKRVGDMSDNVRFQQNNLGAQLWNQDVQNVLSASGMAPGFDQNNRQSFAAMMGYGDRLQNQLQTELGEQYNEYMRQYNHPMNMADWITGKLSQLSGGYGSNWSAGQSPIATGLGAGAALYGLLG